MSTRKTKDETTQELAGYHFLLDASMTTIYRIMSSREEDANEPIKLLEVTPNSSETGAVDAFLFTPDEDIEYWTAIALVTPDELNLIRSNKLELPDDWDFSTALTLLRSDVIEMEQKRP
jgi:hypothetical protein